MVGLPDRVVDTGKQERVSFVIRLLQPRAGAAKVNPDPRDCDEMAMVNGTWQPAADPASLPDGEEQHPLSPLTYTEIDGRHRRLFIGLVPVGKRESYLAASQPQPGTETGTLPPLVTARQMLFKSQVLGPWSIIEETATAAHDVIAHPEKPFDSDQLAQLELIRNRTTAQVLSTSWYIFLDFANYLSAHATPVWNALTGVAGDPPNAAQVTLLATLIRTRHLASGLSFATALVNAKRQEQVLEAVRTPYASGSRDWPSAALIFPLAELSDSGAARLTPAADRTTIESQVAAALNPEPAAKFPVRVAAQARANPMASPWFTIRCILERPNCPALTQPLLSEPTACFQLAGYFDPDAPSRPIRIGLPVDTTPAGLRKFDRNTAFIMSDTLCGQVKKAQGMTLGDLIRSVLPFPLHKDLDGGSSPCGNGIGAGMVCSFSIPIITICALMLLIIFVKLLDIVFFWMPFFQVCLPLPKFTAKGES
jgi:hypothetical protein